jgi:predicted acetyltransferase
MGIHVRRLRNEAEFEQYIGMAAYAFNAPRDEDHVRRYSALIEFDWCLGVFDGDDLVAGMTIFPFHQHFLGATIPLGGVATVASLPERRRGGHVGLLLRSALQEMKDAGQPLSGLYTPHFSLYRRFGWEIAHRMISYAFAPKAVATRVPRPQGTFRRVTADAWQELHALREAFVARRNGALVRTEGRWRHHVFAESGRGQHDAVVWSNTSGEPRGYAVYTQHHRQTRGPWGETTLRVLDWVALDSDAYSALLNFLLGHDLVDQIVMTVGEDEPLPAALEEPTHLQSPPGVWHGMLLRVVDLPAAIEARPVPPETSALSVTVNIVDDAAPWNAGCWRLASGEGRLSAEPAPSAQPGAALHATALGAMFNGFARPADLARASLITGASDDALETLRRMFATPHTPFCPDDF